MLKPFTFFYSRNHKRSFYAVFILKIVKHGCLLVNVKKICLAKARQQMKCPVTFRFETDCLGLVLTVFSGGLTKYGNYISKSTKIKKGTQPTKNFNFLNVSPAQISQSVYHCPTHSTSFDIWDKGYHHLRVLHTTLPTKLANM